jgi:hypothetical protein
MSMRRLRAVYRARQTGWYPDIVTVEDMEATKELYWGETFGSYYERHRDILDIFEEFAEARRVAV